MSSLKARLSQLSDGAGVLFFIQILATLGIAVLYSALVPYATQHLHFAAKDATTTGRVRGVQLRAAPFRRLPGQTLPEQPEASRHCHAWRRCLPWPRASTSQRCEAHVQVIPKRSDKRARSRVACRVCRGLRCRARSSRVTRPRARSRRGPSAKCSRGASPRAREGGFSSLRVPPFPCSWGVAC